MYYSIIFIGLFCVFAQGHPEEDEKISTQYDDIDIDEILKNTRLLDRYKKCVLDKAPCTREGKFIKELIPKSISTDCGGCSDTQKKMFNKLIVHFYEKDQKFFKKLEAKFDKDGFMKKKYAEIKA